MARLMARLARRKTPRRSASATALSARTDETLERAFDSGPPGASPGDDRDPGAVPHRTNAPEAAYGPVTITKRSSGWVLSSTDQSVFGALRARLWLERPIYTDGALRMAIEPERRAALVEACVSARLGPGVHLVDQVLSGCSMRWAGRFWPIAMAAGLVLLLHYAVGEAGAPLALALIFAHLAAGYRLESLRERTRFEVRVVLERLDDLAEMTHGWAPS